MEIGKWFNFAQRGYRIFTKRSINDMVRPSLVHAKKSIGCINCCDNIRPRDKIRGVPPSHMTRVNKGHVSHSSHLTNLSFVHVTCQPDIAPPPVSSRDLCVLLHPFLFWHWLSLDCSFAPNVLLISSSTFKWFSYFRKLATKPYLNQCVNIRVLWKFQGSWIYKKKIKGHEL